MTLEYEANTAVAHWLVESGAPVGHLVFFGPKGYESYARIRFIPDPVGPEQREADVRLPPGQWSDLVQTQRVVRRLAEFTTAEDGYFAVWDGYSDVPLPTYAGLFELPHRRYAIFKGPLAAIDGWGFAGHPPAFVWPHDRAWCFAKDVDPHWGGVGATHEAVQALVDEPGLDVVRADPEQRRPHYG